MADITAAARAELQEAEARNPQESQSVRLTILMGAEVAAQWRAEREAKRGEEREQLRELVTTVVQVPGEEEPRVISRDIPETLGDMVVKAGQDNNHLQKVVNVHESAFTWVRRYKTSNSASEKRRLRDLLSRHVAVSPRSRPALGCACRTRPRFRIRQQFALPALCARHRASR